MRNINATKVLTCPVVNQALRKIPPFLGYLVDVAQPIPGRVVYFPANLAFQRAAAITPYAFIFQLLLSLFMSSFTVRGLLAGNIFNAVSSAFMVLFFATWSGLTYARIRAQRRADQDRREGRSRVGLYIDNNLLIWREDGRFCAWPREFVDDADWVARYNPETKQTSTWLRLNFNDGAEYRYCKDLDDAVLSHPASIASHINAWRRGVRWSRSAPRPPLPPRSA